MGSKGARAVLCRATAWMGRKLQTHFYGVETRGAQGRVRNEVPWALGQLEGIPSLTSPMSEDAGLILLLAEGGMKDLQRRQYVAELAPCVVALAV